MPAKKFASQLDLQRIPLLGLVPDSNTSGNRPGTPVNGLVFYNTTLGALEVYENGAWVQYAHLVAGKVPIGELPTGTTGTTVALGNDSRFTDSRTPNGTAGGHLSGSYPNPTIASAVVTDAHVAAANKDGAAGTASMRTLGTGATQAAAGNDSRFTDSRTPTGSASGHLTGTYPSPSIANTVITDAHVVAANKDGAVGTASMRTLGSGAQQAMPGNYRLDQIAVPTTTVSMNSNRIINVADPTGPQDAATKAYVDAARTGLDAKESVRAATTANITLSGLQTIDGITLVANDRVLVKDQSTASQNGIYTAQSGAWVRATDADSNAEVTAGMFTFVEQGTTHGDTGWVLSTDNPITLGTTSLSFVQFSSAGVITAGNGLTKTGNTLDVGGTTNRITVTSTAVDIAATYVGQTSITTLGTVTTGTWNGTSIAVANGGTGATTATAARTNLGAVGKYAVDLGALTAGVEATITHGLNTNDVQAQFRTTVDGYEVEASWRVINTTQIGITTDVSYGASAIRAVVIG